MLNCLNDEKNVLPGLSRLSILVSQTLIAPMSQMGEVGICYSVEILSLLIGRSFANDIFTEEGGMHLEELPLLLRVLNGAALDTIFSRKRS